MDRLQVVGCMCRYGDWEWALYLLPVAHALSSCLGSAEYSLHRRFGLFLSEFRLAEVCMACGLARTATVRAAMETKISML